MYICSCHAVTDGAIRAAIKSGTNTFAQLAKLTGIATQCGICGRQAKALFYQIREEETGIRNPNSPVQEPSCAASARACAGGCKGCPGLSEKPK